MIEKPGLSKEFWRAFPIAILFSSVLWLGVVYGIIKIWKVLG